MSDQDNIPQKEGADAKSFRSIRFLSDTSSNMLSYYEEVEKNPTMNEEEEKKLFEGVRKVAETIRRQQAKFLFVLQEHEKIIDECKNIGNIPARFCEAELKNEERENHELILRALPAWKAEIRELREKLEAAYRDNQYPAEQRHALQRESYELLNRYPVSREKVDEWNQVIKVYVGRISTYSGSEIHLTNCAEEDYASYEALTESLDCYYDLRSKFVNANLRLVLSQVRKFNCSPQQYPDLIQEGNLGLIQAFDRFDFRLGTKFSTYATWWIRRNIANAISTQSRVINIPPHMYRTIAMIRHTEEQLFMRKGTEVTSEELAAVLQMPVARIHAIKMMAAQPISLQSTTSDEEDGWTPENFLYDSDAAGPDRELNLKNLKEELLKALQILSEREQLIIRNHFGLDGYTPMDTQQLADIFGVTRKKIRQIERYAFTKLRNKVAPLYNDMV